MERRRDRVLRDLIDELQPVLAANAFQLAERGIDGDCRWAEFARPSTDSASSLVFGGLPGSGDAKANPDPRAPLPNELSSLSSALPSEPGSAERRVGRVPQRSVPASRSASAHRRPLPLAQPAGQPAAEPSGRPVLGLSARPRRAGPAPDTLAPAMRAWIAAVLAPPPNPAPVADFG